VANDDLEARRERLRKTLEEHEAAEEAEAARVRRTAASPYGQAFRMSSEFISAVAVGALIGWGLDWALGTTPWLMVLFLLLGFVAGVLNVLRSAGLIKRPQAGKRRRDGA
jgi:ATP synthase protein I